MPPKKKKGKKKKKKKDGGELTAEDKFKQKCDEIEALKDHLAVRKEFARRSQTYGELWKSRMKDAESTLEDNVETHKAVSADMTRQYKTMQTEMGLRIHQLETELARTRSQLEQTEFDLKTVREEKDKMQRDKDQEIADLKLKNDTMALQYQHLLNDALDKLIDKLDIARDSWDEHSTLIQTRNKQTLLEFGLNPLDI